MSDTAPSDHRAVESRLRRLRQRLDRYGVQRSLGEPSWDELLDLYDHALEEAATRLGIVVPDRPRSIGRRFTRRQREQLEAELKRRDIRVR